MASVSKDDHSIIVDLPSVSGVLLSPDLVQDLESCPVSFGVQYEIQLVFDVLQLSDDTFLSVHLCDVSLGTAQEGQPAGSVSSMCSSSRPRSLANRREDPRADLRSLNVFNVVILVM